MLKIDKKSFKPSYLQLKEELTRRIESGTFQAGQKIPSVRQLVKDSGLSHITVARSVSELIQEGALISRKGKGAFVADCNFPVKLKKQRQMTIAIIHTFTEITGTDPFYTPFSHEVMRGINGHASDAGIGLIHVTVEEFLANNFSVPVHGGIILLADGHSHCVQECVRVGIPIVQVLRHCAEPEGNFIDGQYYRAAFISLDHLIQLGHRDISFMISAARGEDFRPDERIRGYRDALSAIGLELEETQIFPVSQKISACYELMSMLLAKKNRPTAVVALSDLDALGAIKAIHEAGLRVPEDISVIGFLGVEVMKNNRPRLTTVNMNMKQLGQQTLAALIDLIEGNRRSPIREFVPARLELGETTGEVKDPWRTKDNQ